MSSSPKTRGASQLARFREASASFSRNRACKADLLLQFGEVAAIVQVRDGRVAQIVEDRVPLRSWDFAVKGSEEGWDQFWQKFPPPGWHDILALNKRRVFSIEGNLHPLMSHLQFYKDLLACARERAA
ncbi:MAG: hypothetical protein IT507_12830 [Burkholderiaceae bacterium]|nr:hypothetical protein [Burkholderiaceae bacterium]